MNEVPQAVGGFFSWLRNRLVSEAVTLFTDDDPWEFNEDA